MKVYQEKLQNEVDVIENELDALKADLNSVKIENPDSGQSADTGGKSNRAVLSGPAGRFEDLQRAVSAKTLELRRKSRRFIVKKVLITSERFDLERLKEERADLEMNNANVRDYLTELASMQRFHFDALATIPSQLLTQILILSMGALGSIIFLTRAFLTPRLFKPFSWYLFRPFLGMVTALAMFVLTKSGLGIVSGESAATSLNPFVISFIAIISGILSEQAYERHSQCRRDLFPDRSGQTALVPVLEAGNEWTGQNRSRYAALCGCFPKDN